MATKTPVVRFGDRIRFSVVLLRQILHQKDDNKVVVTRVVDIRTDADGVKTIVLQKVEA